MGLTWIIWHLAEVPVEFPSEYSYIFFFASISDNFWQNVLKFGSTVVDSVVLLCPWHLCSSLGIFNIFSHKYLTSVCWDGIQLTSQTNHRVSTAYLLTDASRSSQPDLNSGLLIDDLIGQVTGTSSSQLG